MTVARQFYKYLALPLPLILSASELSLVHANVTPSQKTTPRQKSYRIAEKLDAILNGYQLTYDIDRRSVDSAMQPAAVQPVIPTDVIRKIVYFIDNNLPIDIRMVGFPFKSINQNSKVIDQKADMAERLSLQYLQGMIDKINVVYSKGATLTIICDGIAFGDVLGVDNVHIQLYEDTLRTLSKDLPGIRILGSKELGCTSADFQKEIAETISADDELLLKRMALELNQSTITDDVLIKAKQIGARSQQFGAFIKDKFKDQNYISASVHFQPSTSSKLGLKLSPDSYITPWHGALVKEENGRWRISHREDIDQTHYVQTGAYVNQCWCVFFKAR
ncbi:MAG: L-tyrosine/L-tryptophan isonitrile synthase family protein [Pseudomonadota bacterium]